MTILGERRVVLDHPLPHRWVFVDGRYDSCTTRCNRRRLVLVRPSHSRTATLQLIIHSSKVSTGIMDGHVRCGANQFPRSKRGWCCRGQQWLSGFR